MTWPLTINGHTWTEQHFQPWAYATNLPDLLRDVADVAGATEAARVQAASLYAALLSQTYPVVAVTSAVSLSMAAHNGRILQVSGAGSILAPWNTTGAGFSCLVLNLTATALPINASGTTLRHPDGHGRIRVDGLAALLGTDGAPGRLQLVGQTEA